MPGQSCIGCPSYLESPDAVVSKFKKAIGAPVCGRYGHVLGRPGAADSQVQKLARHFASKCDAHGEPLPPIPVTKRLQVMLPDPAMLTTLEDGDAKKDACTSCGMCAKFVPDRVVVNELGWTAGMCSAKGKLVLMNQQTVEARGCEYREHGQVRSQTMGMQMLPEYEDAFQLAASPIAAFMKAKASGIIEPEDYPTDKPVSPADEAKGIRAWRSFKDPEGSGNEAFLPVYRLDFFDDTERSKIPRSGDDEHPEMYVDHFGGMYMLAVCWSELDETPAFWGEAGTGKTELFRHAAWVMCLPFERISITAQTEVDDLVGKMMFSKERGTYFSFGRLPVAWTKPCVLCLDEPNVGQPEVWQVLRPLTDNSKQMVVDQGEFHDRVPRHSDCYLGMAMNPAWDVKNVGANQIGDADASRLFHVYVDLPPEVLEREIIKARVALDGWEMDDKRLDTLMRIAKDIRALAKDGTIPITWGIRPQIKVARALRWFEPIVAYRRAVGDYLEPDAQTALLDQVRAHVS